MIDKHENSSLRPGRWAISPSETTLTVFAKKLGLFHIPATLDISSGSIEIDSDHRVTSIEVIANSASYQSANEKRNAHIRGGDFLAADAHPTISFRCEDVAETPDGYEARGSVTVKGKTAPLILSIDSVSFETSTCEFSASGTINRNDIGISKLPSFIIGNTLSLRVQVKATVEQEGQGR